MGFKMEAQFYVTISQSQPPSSQTSARFLAVIVHFEERCHILRSALPRFTEPIATPLTHFPCVER